LKNKATEYERVLKKYRKGEGQMKEEIVKLKNQLSIQKQNFDQKLFELQNDNEGLKEELTYTTNDLNNRISEVTRENAELNGRLVTAEEERTSLRSLVKDLRQKLEEYKSLTSDYEQEKIKHQDAQQKIKALEYEVSSYGDWKDMAKASHSRMNNMSEMEKEVVRLRQVNKNLHDSLGNKLLLEEETHNLKTRLERFEKSSVEQIKLETQIKALDRELKDWKQLGVDFVQKGAANNPINVRSYIEQLMHRDLLLVSEKTSFTSEKSTIEVQRTDLKNVSKNVIFSLTRAIHHKSHLQLNEGLVKQNETLEKSLKLHQSVITKLQRKLKLIQSERDAQRQLLDSYEKDLTVTQGAQTSSSQETQFRLRIDMLSNSLAGYKELCAKLEAEMAELRGNPGNAADGTVCTREQYKILRKDLETLRSENEKLRKRKSELEIEIENITLRSNVMHDDERLKIVHFTNNPAAIAQEQAANEVAKLRAEVERLKLRNRKLEEGNEDLTTRSNETMNMTLNIKDLQKLREEHKTLQSKYRENEDIFKNVNQELREVVYMLFGFKLDRFGNSNYRYAHASH
jgi:mitotic spindle assembly checkpoint protein MAD1